MKNKFILLILLFSLIVLKEVQAQSAGLNFTLGFPQREFNDNVKRTGFGGSLNFNLLDPSSPVNIGINVGYINLGMESRREYFSSYIPDVYVNVDRTNNLINFHLLFQLIVPAGPIRPYVEGLFGGSYLFTETRIQSMNSDEEVASSNNITDFAWSYGAGGGFLIKLTEPGDMQIGSVFLDLKVRYLFGTEAEYLTPGSVYISHGIAYYYISKSKTDMLTANIGAVVTFNSLFNGGGN